MSERADGRTSERAGTQMSNQTGEQTCNQADRRVEMGGQTKHTLSALSPALPWEDAPFQLRDEDE